MSRLTIEDPPRMHAPEPDYWDEPPKKPYQLNRNLQGGAGCRFCRGAHVTEEQFEKCRSDFYNDK